MIDAALRTVFTSHTNSKYIYQSFCFPERETCTPDPKSKVSGTFCDRSASFSYSLLSAPKKLRPLTGSIRSFPEELTEKGETKARLEPVWEGSVS